MKTEFNNIMHRADMPKKFAGAPWDYLEILLDKNHPA